MKRIRKVLCLIVFTFVFTIGFRTNVEAASAYVSISSSASTIVVGNNVTFYVTVSGDSPLGVWDYGTSASSNLTYISGSPVLKTGILPPNKTTKSVSYQFTYRAKASGNAAFSFRLSNIYDVNENPMGIGGTLDKYVNIITQAQLEASYSKNNNLSSLAIEGYQLSPAFNKNTLEYSIELPNGTTKINIIANKEDSKANIQGAGSVDVVEGANRFEIKVTAQNGSVKTYVLNVKVKELDPILVKVDGKEYNVVRKKEQITAPNSTYTEKVIKINDLEVPAFENKKLGYTLVGLKDSDANINLYIYDEKNNTYTLYKEYNFKSSIICILDDTNKIPDGYSKATVKIGKDNVTAYKLDKTSKFYLFYGVNVETGKKNLYVYDSNEETIQRYNGEELLKDSVQKEELYQYIIIGLGSLLIITYFILLIVIISNSRKKKKEKMKKMSKYMKNIEDNESNNEEEKEVESEE